MAIPKGGEEVISSTVCLEVQTHMLGVEKRISSEHVKTEDTDKKRLRVTKLILESPILNEIAGLRSKIAASLKEIKVPTKMFRHGVYLIPQKYVGEIETRLTVARKDMLELVDKLVPEYTDLKAAAKESLGKLYDEKDYPPETSLRAEFDIEWNYLAFDVPAALKDLNLDLFIREREKAEKRWDEAAEEIRLALRESFSGFVEHFVDKLTPGDDGKLTKFKQPVVDKMNEFIRFFEGRNVTSDQALDDLVVKAREMLEGRSAEELRKDETIRERILAGFKTLSEKSDELLVEYTRQVNLTEDAVAEEDAA